MIGSDQVAGFAWPPIGQTGTHIRRYNNPKHARSDRDLSDCCRCGALSTGFREVDLAALKVKFRALTDTEIENYLQAERPL